MLPDAWEALVAACQSAKVPLAESRVVQTVGSAPASAGVHASDGHLEDGEPWCAATDISVHHPTELPRAKIKALVSALWSRSFVAYYRRPGSDGWPPDDEEHIHVIWAGCHMKQALRNQVHAALALRNGLKSSGPYTFYIPTAAQQQGMRSAFLAHNPATG